MSKLIAKYAITIVIRPKRKISVVFAGRFIITKNYALLVLLSSGILAGGYRNELIIKTELSAIFSHIVN